VKPGCNSLFSNTLLYLLQYDKVRDLFTEVKNKTNVGDDFRLINGTKELGNCMGERIADVGLSHGSQIMVVMRNRGGSDPRVQILYNCGNKDVVGVSTPSLRACPHCGALVQHIEACKHMNCPACKQNFCFICLKVPISGSWQCGSYNSKCSPAPRQGRIPG